MQNIVSLLFAWLTVTASFACTTFTFSDNKGNIVFGRNFDFPVGEGHIEINYRNLQKTSMIMPPEAPLTWTSKYGSITFNQAGKEFPYGGMNEAGLVIEQMWLQETVYPAADDRHGLIELQWVQYQLDNAATVKEVIDSDTLVRISFTAYSTLHFLVSDAEGNAAVIEYLDGKMMVRQNESLPFRVLANCPYERSLEYQKSINADANAQFNDWTRNSSGRFVKAAEMLTDYSGEPEIVEYAFRVLDSVSQENNTQWSIVYDISNLEIHYRTSKNPEVQLLDFAAFDFSCQDGPAFAGITENIQGSDSFKPLGYEDNYKMIEYLVSSVEFLRQNLPAEAMAALAGYAWTTICGEDN